MNSDMLKTKHRLRLLVNACLEAKQRFVLDNTNVSKQVLGEFIALSKAAGFRVAGYYFRSDITSALARNSGRTGSARIPDISVLGTYKMLEIPQPSEGFDALYYVYIDAEGRTSSCGREELTSTTCHSGNDAVSGSTGNSIKRRAEIR